MCWRPDTMENPRSHCLCKTSPLKEPVGVNLFVRETERQVQDNRSRGHRPVLVNRASIGLHALGANRNICFFLDLAVVEHSELWPTWEGGLSVDVWSATQPPLHPFSDKFTFRRSLTVYSVMTRPVRRLHTPHESGLPVLCLSPIHCPISSGFLSTEQQEVWCTRCISINKWTH